MRIIDQNGNEISSPNLDLGYLEKEEILIQQHPATPAVPEVSHITIVREFSNGGKETRKVIETEAQSAKEPWDEYETVLRYIPYTPEELEEMVQPSPVEDLMEMTVDHAFRLTLLELGVM